MKDKGVPRTGDKLVRKPARQRGNTDIRPFKAPRLVTKDTDSNNNTEVEAITETEIATDLEARQDKAVFVNPEQIKSSELLQDKTVVLKTKAPRKVKGWVYITESEDQDIPVQKLVAKETEQKDSSGESDDNVPVATLLQYKTATSLTSAQVQDIKEGPQGQKAVGVTVCKMFEGVKFEGKVDSFRQVRQRFYYHIIYSDGDEEEMSQIELRDAYVLANAELIEAEWSLLKSIEKGKDATERQDDSDVETSDGEGSEYDRLEYEREVKQTKRKRKELMKKAKKPKKNDLSGIILPQSGDKTVAGEAFAKLNKAQKNNVAAKVNKKTKQVLLLYQIAIAQLKPYQLCALIFHRQLAKQSVREQIFDVGHHDRVKEKLRLLLTSEMVPITEMHHDGIVLTKTIEDEGQYICHIILQTKQANMTFFFSFKSVAMWAIGWRYPATTLLAFVRREGQAS
jgi:hypothetical protein